MFDPSQLVIYCCYIKKSYFFEDTMCRFWDAGYKNIRIFQTGAPTFGQYEGPYSKYWATKQTPYGWNQALIDFQNDLRLDNVSYQYLLLIDFDLFMSDINEFNTTLEAAVEGQYDRVSQFRTIPIQDLCPFNGKVITEVPPAKVISVGDPDIPRIEMPLATGLELFSRRAWESFTAYDFWHDNRMARAFSQRGFKAGATYSNLVSGDRRWGKEYFHVSNLTAYYHLLEWPDIKHLDHLIERQGDYESVIRLGYFAKQEDLYGNIYPANIQTNLQTVWQKLGGRARCLETWNEIVKGTCMENWQPYRRKND